MLADHLNFNHQILLLFLFAFCLGAGFSGLGKISESKNIIILFLKREFPVYNILSERSLIRAGENFPKNIPSVELVYFIII